MRTRLLPKDDDVATFRPPTGTVEASGIVEGENWHPHRPHESQCVFEGDVAEHQDSVTDLGRLNRELAVLQVSGDLKYEEGQVVCVDDIRREAVLSDAGW